MFRAVVVLAIASVVLAALALISCLSVEDKREIRGMPRFVWVLAILLLPLLGPIGWFVSGRPEPLGGGPAAWLQATGHTTPSRPTAPDDDPDFLRSLAQRTRGGDQPPDRRESPPHRRESANEQSSDAGESDAGDPDTVDGGTLSEEEQRLLQQWEQDLQHGGDTSRPGGRGKQGKHQDDRHDHQQGDDQKPSEEDEEEERRRRDSGSDG